MLFGKSKSTHFNMCHCSKCQRNISLSGLICLLFQTMIFMWEIIHFYRNLMFRKNCFLLCIYVYTGLHSLTVTVWKLPLPIVKSKLVIFPIIKATHVHCKNIHKKYRKLERRNTSLLWSYHQNIFTFWFSSFRSF